jgi:hypothetical protein
MCPGSFTIIHLVGRTWLGGALLFREEIYYYNAYLSSLLSEAKKIYGFHYKYKTIGGVFDKLKLFFIEGLNCTKITY